jgi:hypothetical protein
LGLLTGGLVKIIVGGIFAIQMQLKT